MGTETAMGTGTAIVSGEMETETGMEMGMEKKEGLEGFCRVCAQERDMYYDLLFPPYSLLAPIFFFTHANRCTLSKGFTIFCIMYDF